MIHALAWHNDLRNRALFVRVLSDGDEAVRVRGQAAEGLAYGVHRKRRGFPSYERAFRVLCGALRDLAEEGSFLFGVRVGRYRRPAGDSEAATAFGGTLEGADQARLEVADAFGAHAEEVFEVGLHQRA